MSLGLLCLILLALAGLGYVMGPRRAIASAAGDIRNLHSLPAFYVPLTPLCVFVPIAAPLVPLVFAHGFNVHYGAVIPRADLDVWMVAPKAPGHTVRNTYTQGGGVPRPVAVPRDKSGQARDMALTSAMANGAGQAGTV